MKTNIIHYLVILVAAIALTGMGIDVAHSSLAVLVKPDQGDGGLRVEETDMTVHVLARDLKANRLYLSNHWTFFPDWQPLTIDKKGGQYQGFYKDIKRGRSHYKLDMSGNLTADDTPVWKNVDDPKKWITGTATGFKWRQLNGDWIEYDSNGVPLQAGDRHGLKLEFLYDPENRLEKVDSADGREIFVLARDADGNVTSVTDLSGRKVRYTWTSGLLTQVTDVRGNNWTYQYKEFSALGVHALSSRTDPLGRKREFNYSVIGGAYIDVCPSGKTFVLRQVVDPQTGNVTYQYQEVDAGGSCFKEFVPLQLRLTDWVRSDGKTTKFRFHYNRTADQYSIGTTRPDGSFQKVYYSANGRALTTYTNGQSGPHSIKTPTLDAEFDVEGNATVYHKNEKGEVTEIDRPDGSSIKFQYDPIWGLITEKVDENGVITRYDRNANGDIIKKVEAVGTAAERTTEYVRNSLGLPTNVKILGDQNTEQAVYQNSYDQDGNLTSAINPIGATTQFKNYNAVGDYGVMVDPRGNSWTYDYDAAGHLVNYVTPKGAQTTLKYDSAGFLSEISLPGINVPLKYAFSSKGRLKQFVSASGAVTKVAYTEDGMLSRITDALGHVFSVNYISAQKASGLVDPAGNTFEFSYQDASGAPTSKAALVSTPTYVEHRAYDSRQRLTKLLRQDPTGKTSSESYAYDYDPAGNIIKSSHGSGRSVTYAYDALNRITTVTDADGRITRYQWDDQDNLIGVVDATGAKYQFVYDKIGEMVEEHRPGSKVWHYSYDKNGNPKVTRRPDGSEVRYTYDIDNRLVRERRYSAADLSNPGQDITYAWYPMGWLKSYNDGTTSESYVYDNDGRVIQQITNFGVFSKTQSFTWNAAGFKSSATNPEGIDYQYKYTKDNQIDQVVIPNVGTISATGHTWKYPTGMQYPGGAGIQVSHDAFQRLAGQKLSDAAGNELESREYGINASDEFIAISKSKRRNGVQQAEVENYTYDPAGRLIGVSSDSGSSETYTYDPIGDRMSGPDARAYAYGESHELLSQTQDTGEWVYSYNANGSLDSKAESDGSGILLDSWRYEYDLQGRLSRVSRKGALVATYTYDPFGRRLSKTVNGVTTYFLYNDTGLVAEYGDQGQLVREYQYSPEHTWGTYPLFQRQGDGKVYYYYDNQIGAPVSMFDSAGNVVWSADYASFGRATVTIDQVQNPLRLPGQYEDAETGLHYNWKRYYDPEVGRYIRQDPIGLAGGINNYLYAGASPIGNYDYNGQWIMGAILGAACAILQGKSLCKVISAAVSGAMPIPSLGVIVGAIGDKFCDALKGECVSPGDIAGKAAKDYPKDKAADKIKEHYKDMSDKFSERAHYWERNPRVSATTRVQMRRYFVRKSNKAFLKKFLGPAAGCLAGFLMDKVENYLDDKEAEQKKAMAGA